MLVSWWICKLGVCEEWELTVFLKKKWKGLRIFYKEIFWCLLICCYYRHLFNTQKEVMFEKFKWARLVSSCRFQNQKKKILLSEIINKSLFHDDVGKRSKMDSDLHSDVLFLDLKWSCGVKNPIHSCWQTQWEMIFDHKVSKGSLNNELKFLVILPVKIIWEKLCSLKCTEILLGWVPEDQILPLISSIEFWVLKNAWSSHLLASVPHLWNAVEEAEVDKVHAYFMLLLT